MSDVAARMPHPTSLLTGPAEERSSKEDQASEQVTLRPPGQAGMRLIVYTRHEQRIFPVAAGSVIGIGRAATNTVRLDDPLVSRLHARIYISARVEVEDLGSANGSTLVRGQRTGISEELGVSLGDHKLGPSQRTTMVPGDVLRVGGAVLVLEEAGSVEWSAAAVSSRIPVVADPEMRRVYEIARRAAASDIAVLILGEAGVGKEVLAETIHHASLRGGAPFLRLNCAAVSEAVLESELFGHESREAHAAKVGLLESANGGTVFLDEIGEMPHGTQAKLLRALEDRTAMRVGSSNPYPIDVRFVTATNHDLVREVRESRFRGDLFYRIGGLVVRIPALRQRVSEIEPLARHFVREFCRRAGKPEPLLAPSAVELLRQHAWPGNVRELRSAMERAVLLSADGVVGQEHVQLEPELSYGAGDMETDADTQVFDAPTNLRPVSPGAREPRIREKEPEAHSERERVIRALEESGGNQTRAARLLGVSRRTLINRLVQFQLPRPRKG